MNHCLQFAPLFTIISAKEAINLNQVGHNIKKLRKSKGITQEQLAEQLSVTRQAISSWENGINQPDVETLARIAEYFGVTVEELIYGKQSKQEGASSSVIEVGKNGGKAGIGFGAALAMIISYTHWQSIGWAILHGLMGWGYVIYYIIKY